MRTIVLITTTPTELQEVINRIAKSGSRYGLVINKGKTKVMTTEGKNSHNHRWRHTAAI